MAELLGSAEGRAGVPHKQQVRSWSKVSSSSGEVAAEQLAEPVRTRHVRGGSGEADDPDTRRSPMVVRAGSLMPTARFAAELSWSAVRLDLISRLPQFIRR